MTDRLRHFNTEKQSSSAPRIDFTRRLSQEKSESQHRGEKRNSATSSSQEVGKSKASSSDLARDLTKRNSATSSSQEAGRPKASSSDLVRKLDRLRISKKTDHQRPSGQWPTGTPFSRERSRATSSSFPGRDARGQRKDDSLLRTQGRRLRGGWGRSSEDSSERNVNVTDEELEQLVEDSGWNNEELAEFDRQVQALTKKYL
jgi:hypothetical protein